ncbi:MAG: ABC transporter permease [Actinomycetes bacterium]
MYPNLTPWLVSALAVALGVLLLVALRQPVLGRLAGRQVRRRPLEGALVVVGSVLGTAIIVGSLVVGDSLDRSVREVAYTTLGPVDEKVTSPTTATGDEASVRLSARLARDPDVDGLLSMRVAPAAAVHEEGNRRVAEPRALVWETDLDAAAQFGAAGQDEGSGLTGPNPGPDEVVVNDELATSLGVRRGDTVAVHVYDQRLPLRVVSVVPTRGLAGLGLGSNVNRNAFVFPGTLDAAALNSDTSVEPESVTVVSNRGGVESGEQLTDRVERKISDVLGPLVGNGASVDTPKEEVLREATQTADSLGSLFLFIGSFSIIAGVMLLVNIFVMLAEERKSQLGMLRAVGMKRSRLVLAFVLEGSVYAALAVAAGAVLGIGVGRAVVEVAQRIFNSYAEASGEAALGDLTFAVTPVSLVNGAALGFLIAFVTVLVTSVRISRVNIIAAIRDLDTASGRPPRRGLVAASTVGAAVFGAASVPALASSAGFTVYLLPSLALLCLVPLLLRLLPRHTVLTGVPLAILLWALLAPVVRPDVFDDSSTATYVVLGVLLTFSAVFLVGENQQWVIRPFRRFVERSSEAGLARRLAVAYPTARRFRTGATLVMYSLVVFTLVLIIEIGAVIERGVDQAVADGSGGYALRADYNSTAPIGDPEGSLRSAGLADQISEVDPLLTATAVAKDPGGRTDDPLPTTVVGVPDSFARGGFALDKRLARLGDTDAEVWQEVLDDPRYVVVDGFFGATGGPAEEAYAPGDSLTITDQRTGRSVTRTIAAVMSDAQAFYGMGGVGYTYPALASPFSVSDQFGDGATTSSALLRTTGAVPDASLAADLQGRFLTSGLVATEIREAVRTNFAATQSFFRLMEGFLALGLVVGITGLGVVMVRAVRERRRTIGILRALGFRASTIQRSFLTESTFVAIEGVLLGTVLSVVTAYLLYRNSAAFGGIEAGFPVAWGPITLTVGATLVASLLATVAPARRAARIRPAVAVRVAD